MKLARPVLNWYNILSEIGSSSSNTLLTIGLPRITGKFLTSVIYMGHLTMLFCYAVTPIVWAINPKQFNFNELAITAGVFAAITGVVLTTLPSEQESKTVFRRNSGLLSIGRLLLALFIPILSLLLLSILVQTANIQLGYISY